jgi:hypothetical protein
MVISYQEIRSRTTISSQETQHVKNFFFFNPGELELLEKTNQIILPNIIVRIL